MTLVAEYDSTGIYIVRRSIEIDGEQNESSVDVNPSGCKTMVWPLVLPFLCSAPKKWHFDPRWAYLETIER